MAECRAYSDIFRRVLLTTTALTALPLAALAMPQGGRVVEGQGEIVQTSPNTMEIRQTSGRLVVEWAGFNVAQGEKVVFLQPDQLAQVLNRILGDGASRIMGELSANGVVVLSNANGILFGPGSNVDVASLIATTANVANGDFMAGRLNFATGSASGTASIINQGTITAAQGGIVALVAPAVANSGLIQARLGKVALAAGNTFTLDLYGDRLVEFAVDDRVTRVVEGADGEGIVALASNSGTLSADGGLVLMTVNAVRDVIGQSINMSGVARAQSVAMKGGAIVLEGGDGLVNLAGTVDASGLRAGENGGAVAVSARSTMITGSISASGAEDGGTIALSGGSVINQGRVAADGMAGSGGAIAVTASTQYAESATAVTSADGSGAGGSILVDGGSTGHVFASGSQRATASAGRGGDITLTGKDVVLVASTTDASGSQGGGSIRIGGDFQGLGATTKAATTIVSPAATLKADATVTGDGGTVVVWSEDQTTFAGRAFARGGAAGGDGGLIEVSSKGGLLYSGSGDSSAAAGAAGRLLLDPKDLVISSGTGSYPYYELFDPTPGSGDQFGDVVHVLSNGNVVVTDIYDDTGATDAGAFHLFNGTTGALISTMIGDTASDRVGGIAASGTVSQVTEGLGNFIVKSDRWHGNTGAVTYGNGTTGVAGVVSSANSLVGSLTTDRVGNGAPIQLENGNVVVVSRFWNGNRGAVTFIDMSTGRTGVVSSANSLVGSTAGDAPSVETYAGSSNYFIYSSSWDNVAAGMTNAGAVVFGSGTTGVSGTISSANALIGTSAYDEVGSYGGLLLRDGHTLAIVSDYWGGFAGAVSWADTQTGFTPGAVSSANSLVGAPGDYLGTGGWAGYSPQIAQLANGKLVVNAPGWNSDRGAVKLIDPLTTGLFNDTDALVGLNSGDSIGSRGAFAVGNGTGFIVVSPNWDNPDTAATNAGAVTFVSASGTMPRNVTSANSLVGTATGDIVGDGGVFVLSNGNYVVQSPDWTGRAADGGGVASAGAATFGSGSTGISGAVSSANSLVGSSTNDVVGSNVFEVGNSNYAVVSSDWDNGAGATDAGAVTWGSGTAGVSGPISAANSLVGTRTDDYVGENWIYTFANGKYLFTSGLWDNGAIVNAGAVTVADGNAPITGTISSANSVVGLTANDEFGYYYPSIWSSRSIFSLAAPNVDHNGVADTGMVLVGDASVPFTGTVASIAALRGTQANDQVGYNDTYFLDGGWVTADSPYWNGGQGAVLFASVDQALPTAHTAANSLLGQTDGASYAMWVRENPANGTVLATYASEGSGKVRIGIPATTAMTYALGGSQSINLHPAYLTGTLNAGTAVTLQASNDITVNSAITVDNSSGSGGNLTMQAGRSIAINANITTDNGNLTLAANQPNSAGVVSANRDAGAGSITVASGVTVDAGSGTVSTAIGSGVTAGTVTTTGATIISGVAAATAPPATESTAAATTATATATTQQVDAQISAVADPAAGGGETSNSAALTQSAVSGFAIDPLGSSAAPLVDMSAPQGTASTESEAQ